MASNTLASFFKTNWSGHIELLVKHHLVVSVITILEVVNSVQPAITFSICSVGITFTALFEVFKTLAVFSRIALRSARLDIIEFELGDFETLYVKSVMSIPYIYTPSGSLIAKSVIAHSKVLSQ